MIYVVRDCEAGRESSSEFTGQGRGRGRRSRTLRNTRHYNYYVDDARDDETLPSGRRSKDNDSNLLTHQIFKAILLSPTWENLNQSLLSSCRLDYYYGLFPTLVINNNNYAVQNYYSF